METVLELTTATTTTTTTMAVGAALPSLRLHAVPCKKRPLSWYKPPVSPGSPGSPASPGSPVSLVSFSSPASPAGSSSSHEDAGVQLRLAPSPPMAPLLWPAGPGVRALMHPTMPEHASAAVLHAVARSLATSSALGTLPLPVPLGTTAGAAVAASAPVRRQSDFSIEHILRDAGRSTAPTASSPPSSPDDHRRHTPDDAHLSAGSTTAHPEGHFEWLQCTRYRPPKLPRSRRRDGPAQRRLGRNPRIPFSPQQVAVLEGRFRRSHYLSSADVAELSAQLELSETRVKIWFQNRRARERRDGERSTSSPPQQSPNPTAAAAASAHAHMAPAPSLLPRSPVSAFSAPKNHPKSN